MAFVPEDGTGLATANSYIPVQFADDYFSDRGNAKWAALQPSDKETALVQATDYLNMRYGLKFIGNLFNDVQSLLWPRVYADSTIAQMPNLLKQVTAEYAVRASAAPLAPDVAYDDSGRLWTKKLEQVGPLREETSYTNSSTLPLYQFRSYPLPDALVKPLLVGWGSSGVMRA